MKEVIGLIIFVAISASTGISMAQLPGSIEVWCDVDRNAFRAAAQNAPDVTFRFWDSNSGGSQCGPDYVLTMSDLIVLKAKTDRFDGERPRRFASMRAVLGSDANPVQLCAGDETWVDVTVGVQTLTCDFGSAVPQARRRLQSAPYAQVGQGLQGPEGPQGPQGEIGPEGPEGPAGSGGVRVVAEGAGSVTATCPSGKTIEAGWYFAPGDGFPRACTVGATSCSWSTIFSDVSVVDITCK